MHGRWVWWHQNGMKMTDGMYVNNRSEGVWSSWDEEGRIVFRGLASEMNSRQKSIINETPVEEQIRDAASGDEDQRSQLPTGRINAALLHDGSSSVSHF